MIDAVTYHYTYPEVCINGCASWSDLSKDGNSKSQKDVNAKWITGTAPDDANRNCAMPGNDPGYTFWCYCKDVLLDLPLWGYCEAPTVAVPN